jgi:hypothetical protein
MDSQSHSFIIRNLSSPLTLSSNKRITIQISDHSLCIEKIHLEDKSYKMYLLTIFKEDCHSQCPITCTKTLKIQYQSTSLMSRW